MKIKESNPKIKFFNLFLVSAVSTVLLTVLRCVQIKTAIDASTGFYTKKGFLVVLFYVLLFGVCATVAVLSFLSKESQSVEISKIKSTPLFAVSLIFALTVFFDGASSFVQSVLGASETQYVASAFKSLMLSGSLPLFLQSVFALLSGIFFIELAVSFKKGDGTASKHKVAALMPVAWIGCRLLHLFVRKISFMRVSDLFLELSMCALMVLFYMALAQVSSGVYSDESRWRIVGFGLPSMIFAFVISVSRLIFTLVDKSTYINENHPFNISDLVFATFALFLVLALCKKSEGAPKKESDFVS